MKTLNNSQKQLVGAMVGLARALDQTNKSFFFLEVFCHGVWALQNGTAEEALSDVHLAKNKAAPDCSTCFNPCGRTADFNLDELDSVDVHLRQQKYLLLAAICNFCSRLKPDENNFSTPLELLCEAFFAIGYDAFNTNDLLSIQNKLEAFC